MASFPILNERFRFYWNEEYNKLHYSIDLTPTPLAPESGDAIITKFKQECQWFSQVYDAKLNAIKRGIYELDEKILFCEHTINKHFDKYESTLKTITSNALKEATAQLTGTIRDFIMTFKLQLKDTIQERAGSFEVTLASTIDTMLQDVYHAGNAGHKAMLESQEQLIKQIHESVTPILEIKDAIDNFLPYIPTLRTVEQQLQLADMQQDISSHATQTQAPPAVQ
jgi:hypothetical protein